ncbi:MAG: hypothetical protein ACJ75H_15285 [Thermoanaerobaculia bacterium]
MKLARLALTGVLTLVPLGLGWSPLSAAEGPPPKPTAAALPESIKYWVLFRHLTTLEAKATEVEKRGQDGAPYRSVYRAGAKLTDAQAARLSSIAADCVASVEEKDREALSIIRAARALAPRGRLEKDAVPPEPPAELKRLQAERDELIDAAREDLHRAFGDKEFARFQGFVDEKIAPTIRRQEATLKGVTVPPLPRKGLEGGRP